jgi:probable HAF family extracellular repeat protein
MKRISILACILGMYFVSAAWPQQPATKPPVGRHLHHRMTNQTSRTPGLSVSRRFNAQATLDDAAKVWELGTYPGGTWLTTWHINDFGVLVGLGDVPPIGLDGVGYTHTLAAPLFGPHAGEWIDLGALSRKQSKGWEEPFDDISNTGLVVSHSTTRGGYMHGVAWTKETGLVDLGTLADTGDPQFSSYNVSYAFATNKLGTLIVGMSGVDERPDKAPVAWTSSNLWVNGKFVTKWKIHKLDSSAFPDYYWEVWAVNDYGQIIGTAYNNPDDLTIAAPTLWNPRTDGKGWEKVTPLPPSPAYPQTWVYGINGRGEIIGSANSNDWTFGRSLLWKPLDRKGTRYSDAIELPLPNDGFTACEGVGINDLGDLVGDCWNEDGTVDLAVRWTTKDPAFSEVLNFPADWSESWGVNNNRIATVTYGGGEKCPADTYGSCGGAIQFH